MPGTSVLGIFSLSSQYLVTAVTLQSQALCGLWLSSGHGPQTSKRLRSRVVQYVTMGRRRDSGVSARRISQRRDGRVAEGARLESVCTRKGTQGSNPCLSAMFSIT